MRLSRSAVFLRSILTYWVELIYVSASLLGHTSEIARLKYICVCLKILWILEPNIMSLIRNQVFKIIINVKMYVPQFKLNLVLVQCWPNVCNAGPTLNQLKVKWTECFVSVKVACSPFSPATKEVIYITSLLQRAYICSQVTRHLLFVACIRGCSLPTAFLVDRPQISSSAEENTIDI